MIINITYIIIDLLFITELNPTVDYLLVFLTRLFIKMQPKHELHYKYD